MKIKLIAAVIGVLVAVGAIGAGTSWAQNSAPSNPLADVAASVGAPIGDLSFDITADLGPQGGRIQLHKVGFEAAAKALGLTPEQLRAELMAGKSIEDVAKAKGVDLKNVQSAIVAAEKAAIDQAVKDGKLTPAQADKLKAALDKRADKIMDLLKRHPAPGARRLLGAAGKTALDATAKVLGMTPDQLKDALKSGKSIADIAKDKGVDLKTIQSAVVSAEKAAIDQAVKDGKLTPAQADKLKAALDKRGGKILERFQQHHK